MTVSVSYPAFAGVTVMDPFVVLLLHKELSSSGLTGRSSRPRLLDFITNVSGILDHPLSRVMTTANVVRLGVSSLRDTLPHSRGMVCPRCASSGRPEKIRGRGECRVSMHPQPRV